MNVRTLRLPQASSISECQIVFLGVKGRISKRLAKVKYRPDKETKKEEVCLRKQARENTGAERVSKNNVP